MPNLLSLYNVLPYPLKMIAASLWGFHLNRIRYAENVDELVEQALDRENWSAEQWKNWQESQLSLVLYHAANRVPYYRDRWAERRRKGDRASSEYLENWPILHKEDLRTFGNTFISDDANYKKLILDHTSGTTGVPLKIWVSSEGVHKWYALFEARWRRWYGLSRHDRWGMLGGQLVVPFSHSKPPFWVWNAGMNQLYLSTFHISPNFVPAYIEAMAHHQIVYLLGYASSLYDVARVILEQNLQIPPLRAVLSNAEPLYDFRRVIISKAFKCPVIDTYGQAEFVCAASECTEGHLHLWPEVGVEELYKLNADEPADLGQTGRLICTGLLNFAMPLIRYELGDKAKFGNFQSSCHCGRTLPVIDGIEGRTEDAIITPDGRVVEPDTVFQADYPIRGGQIIQETRDWIRVLVIPAPGFNLHTERSLISGLQARIGNMKISIEQVDDIPRTKAGKRQVIVSKLDHLNIGIRQV
jgi:phenylacetate-CoA ligase